MRSIWCVLAGTAALTVTMQAVNWFFEAVGSVPDIEDCGFLAGGLGILAVIYPGLSGLIGYQFSLRLSAPRDYTWVSSLMGALGSAAYLVMGIGLALSREQYGAVSAESLTWSVVYVLLSATGARLGSTLAELQGRLPALGNSGS